ncbi:nitric oxide-associated protein 1 [Physeter macrocephalus]|uniref:Nitric oxide-associated protein 1 n=2 Tax=Physeter macrocephalus TaxID=9755 RepID=A0A2Y9T9Z5_PHYMC|nr:nitric oxide-associated protein 1 [Physeter catodon]|eukprot:XP_023987786.1 nitric oxide-associated protein 1 [Physeter catodon]
MLPAGLTCRLLCSFLRGSTPTIARHGLRETLLERSCAANSTSRHPSGLGCGPPRGARATGDNQGRADMEESFLFPEYVPDSEPAVTLQDQLRELQQRQEEEERRVLQRREERRQQKLRTGRRVQPVVGHPDATVPPSGLNCSGCGAELHCQDPGVPGYLPSEKFLSAAAQEDGGLAQTVCQRCWLLVHHRRALNLQVSREQYMELVTAALRRPEPALVLYMVDLLDLPDALLPHLPALVGPKQLIVLGNKVDLLPQDTPGYRNRLRERLWDDCARAGLLPPPGYRRPQHPSGDRPRDGEENANLSPRSRTVLRDVRLISAKTGYGVEELISALQRSWRYRGDVYLVGATNAGKSTLFNTLLESDYCIAKGAEAIDKATISSWPGTTLNLLKFPICNPTPYRMFQRQKRLKRDATEAEEDLSQQEQNKLNLLKKYGYVVGRVGRTFLYSEKQKDNAAFEFDADSLAFDMGNEPVMVADKSTKRVELTPQDVKDAHWFYDTPGITKENCILSLLTEKEVNIVLPTHSIVPRTFMLKPGMVLFLGAIGRIDFLKGNQSAWFTVVASNFLPVHITSLDKADTIYQKHGGHTLLKVPMGGEERMAGFPPLVAEDITLDEGLGESEAVADIKFSSAGWVAVTPQFKDKLHLRGYTPQGTVLTVRRPLLPHVVNIKGERIRKSVAYKTKKPPALVYNLQKKKKR